MAEKRLKTCAKGHKFYKSSDCPVCPVCAAAEKPESGFMALISAPARRALIRAGISTPVDLAQHTEKEILDLHGIGPKALPVLKQALAESGMAFAEPTIP